MKIWGLVVLWLLAATLVSCGADTTSAIIDNVNITTTTTTMVSGSSQLIFGEVNGTGVFNKNITWKTTSGKLSKLTGSAVTFSAPEVTTTSSLTITATSVADPSKFETIFINVEPVEINSSITSVTANANLTVLNAGSQATLKALVVGKNGFSNAVHWNIVSGGGTLSAASGLSIVFTAPNLETESKTFVRAFSAQDPSKSTIVTLNINPNSTSSTITSVNVSAVSTTLDAAATTVINAIVTGTNTFSDSVTWSILSGEGTITIPTNSSITFTAPNLSTASTTIVQATSVQDPSKSATVSLSINALIPATITDINLEIAKVALRESDTTLLTATVTGTGSFNEALNWSIVPVGIGTLSSNTGNTVTYTAPATSFGRVIQIIAVSQQDVLKKKIVFISVNPAKTSISTGATHSLALKSDGTALGWGNDESGQLGDDDNRVNKPTPVAVAGVTGIVAVAAGAGHSLALKSDGTVLSWGSDGTGQLGDGPINVGSGVPVAVVDLTGIIAIAAGAGHSLALKSDGTLLSWGNDTVGQLGNDAVKANQSLPVLVSGANNIVAIAAGDSHSLALKADGTLLSWGTDLSGQIGNDSLASGDFSTPVGVINASNIIAIAAGGSYSLALKSDGSLLSWGSDQVGQLGDGSVNTGQPSPVAVSDATNIVAIAIGDSHSLALKSDGTLLSWGWDQYGQLGDDTAIVNKFTPVAVSNATNIVAIAAGTYQSMALKSDGSLLSWGSNQFGQLGNNLTNSNQPTPVAVLLDTITIRLP